MPFSPEIHAPMCCAHPSELLAHLKPTNRQLEGLGQVLAFPSSVLLLLVQPPGIFSYTLLLTNDLLYPGL